MVKHWIRTSLFCLGLVLSVVVSALAFRSPIAALEAAAAESAVPVSTTAQLARPVWRVCVRGSGLADLYSSQGDWLQRLDLTDGETMTEAMPPGDYYLMRKDGSFVSFRVAQNAALSMLGGNGWTDGELLYLEDVAGCSVQVVCWLSPEEFDSGEHQICWLTLRGEGSIQSTALHFVPELEPADNGLYCQNWTFRGLTPGDYTLEKDGVPAATVTVTEAAPDYMLVLGGGK